MKRWLRRPLGIAATLLAAAAAAVVAPQAIANARLHRQVEGGAAMIERELPVRLMVAAGIVRDAAAKIDHRLPQQEPVADGPTAEHGRYVANMRLGCHVSDLPSAPAA